MEHHFEARHLTHPANRRPVDAPSASDHRVTPGHARGKHLLIDCRHVPRDVCLDDKTMLAAMAAGAEEAGANVISQVRYKFGADSPPGFTAAIVLDESHCTCHSYADLGLVAMDVFTCGDTDPRDVLQKILARLNLGDVTVTEMARFADDPMAEREVLDGTDVSRTICA